jgi:hypothetical protein
MSLRSHLAALTIHSKDQFAAETSMEMCMILSRSFLAETPPPGLVRPCAPNNQTF